MTELLFAIGSPYRAMLKKRTMHSGLGGDKVERRQNLSSEDKGRRKNQNTANQEMSSLKYVRLRS